MFYTGSPWAHLLQLIEKTVTSRNVTVTQTNEYKQLIYNESGVTSTKWKKKNSLRSKMLTTTTTTIAAAATTTTLTWFP